MHARYGRWLWVSVFAAASFAFSQRGYAQFCTDDSPCDDGKSCTNNDHCSLGINTCLYPKDDTACPPSSFTCVDTIGCDPSNANSDPVTGCIYSQNDGTCDDGLSCTTDGCDPTNSGADPVTGCVHSKDDLACPPSVFLCEDTIGCDPGSSAADPTTGCTYSRNDGTCDDGLSCTTDGCDPTNSGADADGCVYSKDDLVCDDGDNCTTDGCDPDNLNSDGDGCVYSAIPDCCDDDDDCDDGKSCTDNDHCSLGISTCLYPKNDAACPPSPFTCVDTIGCDPSNGGSDPATGCVYSKNDGSCDDGLSCTIDGCDPSNSEADPTTGCIHSRDDAACTAGPGGVDGKTCTDDACNPDNAPPGSTTGCQTSRDDSKCTDGSFCTRSECNPDLGDPASPTGCVYPLNDFCCEEDSDCPLPSDRCKEVFCEFSKEGSECVETPIPNCGASPRVSIGNKGSLLYFSKIELKWDSLGRLTQDTFLTIVNDYPADVFVQWYFINGERPTQALFTGSPPVLVERAHRGWNWFDCTTQLTHDESTYMSVATGLPLGCQRFTALDSPPRTPFLITDPLTYPGRPDPDPTLPGNRVLRGYALAFAVDANGHEISWNHLSGSVDLVNYLERSAWEYNGYAFQCLVEPTAGLPCGIDNVLDLNGVEYSSVFDKLLFDFYAVGSQAFSPGVVSPGGVGTVSLNTDLTLYPVGVDLRQDNDGPITTKAKFDIWNQNEDGFSGTTRCITCWDQTLLSRYEFPNNFLIDNLHTDKGKARIDGVASDLCDPQGSCCNLSSDPDCFPAVDHPFIDKGCSQPAAMLGVSDKLLFFAGPGAQRRQSDAGMNLVGQGTQSATIKWDIITPPQPLTTGPEIQIIPMQVDVESATATPRTLPRGQRTIKE